MTILFNDFIYMFIADPILMVILVLTLGLIILTGWVDAPNTIFTSVYAGSVSNGIAIVISALFNFMGVLLMAVLCAKVSVTISHLVVFETTYKEGLIALSGALLAIFLWTSVASHYKLHTSETHAIVSGITGAAITVSGLSAIVAGEWIKVLYGIAISLFLGFIIAWATVKLIKICFRNVVRKNALFIFRIGQIFSFAGTSFMHGAQDGQKFIGIFVIAIFLEQGGLRGEKFIIPVWLIILCSVFMSIGTIIGGIRIKNSTGLQKVKLEKYEGFSVDFSTTCTMLIASLGGIPISTNHTKIASALGVEGARGVFSIEVNMMKSMLMSILWTYVGCSIISGAMTLLLLKII